MVPFNGWGSRTQGYSRIPNKRPPALFFFSKNFPPCNIQSVSRMLYRSFETLLLLSFFYIMVKSGK